MEAAACAAPAASPSRSPQHAAQQGAQQAQQQSPQHASRRRDRDQHPNAPADRRLIVTGYPKYTQPQDIVEVFSKFGSVRVDRCSSWSATVTLGSAGAARAALGAQRGLHVYGHYLALRPYAEPAPHQPATPKREFPMSKQKGVIIEPKKIDLSGDFHNQLDNILSAVRLTQEDVKCLSQLYADLELALQRQWPGCQAVPFGSITTGLGIKTSDADCFINIPGQFRHPNGNYVNKAKRVLQQFPGTFAEILAIPRANTPIVKLFHIPTATSCDVTFKTPLGAQNSRLLAFLLHAEPRLLPAAVLLKYWAKVHELSGTGKLTNYALTLLLLFYLQQPPGAVLPPVRWLQQPGAAYVVDHWDTGFAPAPLPPAPPAASIAELLGGFFEYYAMFNFDEMVVCPYLGTPVKKELFKDTAELPDEFDRYKKNVLNNYVLPLRYQTPFCVQDPFEQCHNVASTITSKLALDIKTFFKFASNAYEKDKQNGCKDFLKLILLQKPKLVRGKSHPEYRVNLFPRIITTIISFDWKSVVRKLVMEIIENMLKIKLGKVEEKVNPDTRKEKEKYSGAVTKPIWRRKAFSKLYSVLDNMTFEEKQGKITQEILNVEKQELSIQFQLTLTYCHDPKSAVISIKLGAGDLDAFREFGKFFISVMQNWFTELLKPYSMPNCKDTAAKIAETMDEVNNDNEMESDDDDDDCSPATNNIEQASSRHTEEACTNNRTDAGSTHETVTDKEEAATLTNHIDQTLSKNLDKLPISTETLTNKAELLTINAESLTKNAITLNNHECLLENAETLLKHANTMDKPSSSTSDVTVACALK